MKSPTALVHSPSQGSRVRRPTDALLAIFALIVVVLALGLVRALPTGSTELSNDVSRWLHHIPLWLSSGAEVVAALVSIGGGRHCARRAPPTDIRSAAECRNVRQLRRRSQRSSRPASGTASTERWRYAVLHRSNPTILVVDTALVAFIGRE